MSRRRMMMGGVLSGSAPPEEKENCMYVTYRVGVAGSYLPVVSIYFDIAQVSKMFVDGVEVQVSVYVKFATTGEHTVKFVFSQLTTLYRMLYFVSDAMTTIMGVDMSSLDTSEVTTMNGMFYYANNVTEIDMTGLDIGNVTNMSEMFAYCQSLTVVKMTGYPASLPASPSNMFHNVTTNGTFYYNSRTDVEFLDKIFLILNVLPTRWEAQTI